MTSISLVHVIHLFDKIFVSILPVRVRGGRVRDGELMLTGRPRPVRRTQEILMAVKLPFHITDTNVTYSGWPRFVLPKLSRTNTTSLSRLQFKLRVLQMYPCCFHFLPMESDFPGIVENKNYILTLKKKKLQNFF